MVYLCDPDSVDVIICMKICQILEISLLRIYTYAETFYDSLELACQENSESSSLASSSLRSEHHRNSSLKLHLWGSAKKHLSLGGVVYDGQHLRLTSLNEFNFEVIPEGHFIALENEDQPGLVGSMGHFPSYYYKIS